MDRQTKLQQEQAAMAESLKNMQKKINEEKSIHTYLILSSSSLFWNLDSLICYHLKNYM